MSNENQKPQTQQRLVLSSDIGGLVNKTSDIEGVVLNPKEIGEAIAKVLANIGITDVRSVRVFRKDNKPHIQVMIAEEFISSEYNQSNSDDGDWISAATSKNSKGRIAPHFYNAFRNKFFFDRLHTDKKQIKGENYFILNLDAEIVLAFLLNVDFSDSFLRFAAVDLEFVQDIKKEERKKYEKMGYKPCAVICMFSKESKKIGFNTQQVVEIMEDTRR